jgi:ribulose-phosphate 3-epimerase
MIEILPSILSADMARFADQIELVKSGGATMIHVDVMDGHFVPNITIGPPVVASLRKATDLVLDVHLMISDPDRYVPEFARAGANMISIHQEAAVHLDRTLNLIRDSGAKVGVAINPGTPVAMISQVLELVDYVLVMSVNPGFGGQKFIPYSLTKIAELRRMRSERGLNFQIEVDGGVSKSNIAELVRAGVELFVAGNSVYGEKDPRQAVESLKRLAVEATLTRV